VAWWAPGRPCAALPARARPSISACAGPGWPGQKTALAHPRQGFAGRAGHKRQHAPALRLKGQDAPVGGIVVHDEEPFAAQLWLLAGSSCRRMGLGSRLCLDGKVKSRAFSRYTFAFHPHCAAHQLAQPLADGQPQAGAPVLARSRGVHLAERLEQPPQPSGGMPMPVSRHGEMQRYGDGETR